MTKRTMTLQTQTPGGEPQPIPVKEAVAAVQAAIEVCAKATRGQWRIGEEPDSVDADADFPVCCTYHPNLTLAKANAAAIVAARSGYAATLEYLLAVLNPYLGSWRASHDICEQDGVLYRAVAPIVDWHRAQGGRR